MAEFSAYSLELRSPLHLGSRRAGVVALTHRHAPGHLFTYAIAAAAGMRRGASADFFAAALDEVMRRFRFGPAFFMRSSERLDDDTVERELVSSSHHVTLDNETRSAVESALFEVELINNRPDVRLCGGVWYEDGDKLDGRPLKDWLSEIRLGGELKTGMGRVCCDHWHANSDAYPGIGPANGSGLDRAMNAPLPGAALNGVERASLQPWLGRRYDSALGFGRRLSSASLVRLNGMVEVDSRFLPSRDAGSLGCWVRT